MSINRNYLSKYSAFPEKLQVLACSASSKSFQRQFMRFVKKCCRSCYFSGEKLKRALQLPGRTKLNVWKNFQVRAPCMIHICRVHLMLCPKIKAESIVASSFNEVLYLDSDNVPLRDPAYLFDSELYAGKNQPGVVFWPDLNKDHRACCCPLPATSAWAELICIWCSG